jgi:hypothetical protein
MATLLFMAAACALLLLCVRAVAGVPTVAGGFAVAACWQLLGSTVAGIPSFASFSAVASVSALTGVLAAAGVPAVTRPKLASF